MKYILPAVILLIISSTITLAQSPVLNDMLTPGKVASTDVNEVCQRGGLTYSQSHRQTSEALKDWVMREYGMTSRKGFEIDHRVPLCLGGADEADNLWPQDYSGEPNAHEKDKLEAFACRSVCHGNMPLAKAQAWFLAPADWRQSYQDAFGKAP
jgi:hypothetical protein